MPDDIRVEKLSDYEMGELRRLKDWLYKQRVKFRRERDRIERRELRESQKSEQRDLQPALFNL